MFSSEGAFLFSAGRRGFEATGLLAPSDMTIFTMHANCRQVSGTWAARDDPAPYEEQQPEGLAVQAVPTAKPSRQRRAAGETEPQDLADALTQQAVDLEFRHFLAEHPRFRELMEQRAAKLKSSQKRKKFMREEEQRIKQQLAESYLVRAADYGIKARDQQDERVLKELERAQFEATAPQRPIRVLQLALEEQVVHTITHSAYVSPRMRYLYGLISHETQVPHLSRRCMMGELDALQRGRLFEHFERHYIQQIASRILSNEASEEQPKSASSAAEHRWADKVQAIADAKPLGGPSPQARMLCSGNQRPTRGGQHHTCTCDRFLLVADRVGHRVAAMRLYSTGAPTKRRTDTMSALEAATLPEIKQHRPQPQISPPKPRSQRRRSVQQTTDLNPRVQQQLKSSSPALQLEGSDISTPRGSIRFQMIDAMQAQQREESLAGIVKVRRASMRVSVGEDAPTEGGVLGPSVRTPARRRSSVTAAGFGRE